ncbi:carbohydrate-binding family 9-like protein [Parabacteroides sp. PF5-6]|uniref:carbohydrate-binding family 9-like protein n=1 Tax=Parabacteroides sp. PF5-6 TaxID=1742403 RepID=UPI002405C362|nr:carbohydrate-binding family 9-like protein [Parabacteroides sp. PF5-6]MDF9830392.1 hypothetical protein [Parabacteroides sp. PF5-6]
MNRFFLLSAITLLLFTVSCKEKRTKELWYAERPPLNAPTYVCHPTPGPITLDGKLSPEEWDAIPWTTDFVDIEGDGQPLPYHQTRVKMAHDEQGMYFAARLEEPHVWGTVTEHDAVIYHDNDFEIFLNPGNDTHNYLEYEINALGTEWDLFLSKPYRDNPVVLNDWEFAGMRSAVHVEGTLNDPSDTDQYWSLEVFIPWKSLMQVISQKGQPAEGQQMRVNFSRVQWHTEIQDGKYVKIPMPGEDKIREHNWVWAPTGVINIHLPEYWGYVQFTHQAAGNGEVAFRNDPEEELKGKLRQLYYRQREYRQAYDEYSASLANLKAEEIFPTGQLKKLTIHTTPSLYEIIYAIDNSSSWHIRQDGRVWKEKKDEKIKLR